MDLNSPISSLPHTSPVTLRRFRSIGINTFADLLNYFPFRYEDYSIVSTINRLQPGETITIRGKILDLKNVYTKHGLKIQKVVIEDPTGKIEVVWYNQPYLVRLFKVGDLLSVAGTVQQFGTKLSIQPYDYQLGSNRIHTGRLVPVYPEKKGLSAKVIREKIFWLLSNVDLPPDSLPEKIVSFNHLTDLPTAYKNVHFPENKALALEARNRLAFDELFLVQLSAALLKQSRNKQKVNHQLVINTDIQHKLNLFIAGLPFQLTRSQQQVVNEINSDLILKKPMNRFLLGDVGSGKTVVATIACYLTHLNHYQSLFMAPTEILAHQHYQTISKLLKPYDIKVGLFTSSKKIKQYDLIIGTHALLNEKLLFEKVGLVIIDEQHRFGVSQRAKLRDKGINPHLLTMTATPIPRTVALTLFGELDMSIIDEMPLGRIPIKTFFVNNNKRNDCYHWISNEIKNRKIQVFIVCPLIEESENETMKSVKAVINEYENLKNNVFKQYRVGLIHGKLKSKEKEQIMTDFNQKKYDILIATPVVEVGIDISNATIMIIEGSERYGLAQLHQLRGRVGRGDKQSYCFLFTEKTVEKIIQRLRFFTQTYSGQKLAEYDFIHRGAGTIFGTKQHGFINLKIASLSDFSLIKKTRSAVDYFVNHNKISSYPLLQSSLKKMPSENIVNN